MPTSFNEFVTSFQTWTMYGCFIALFIIGFAALIASTWNNLSVEAKAQCKSWTKAPILLLFLVIFTYYGGSKSLKPDGKNVGSDDSIQLAYIDVNYDTNTFHTVFCIAWTNSIDAVNTSTELGFREAASNEWNNFTIPSYAVKSTDEDDPTLHYLEWEYVANTNDYSQYKMWWVGKDRPGIIVDVIGITVTEFTHTPVNLHIAWTCDDTRCTLFEVQYAFVGSTGFNRWITLTTTENKYVDLPGFWYDRDREIRIISEYELTNEGGEE